MDPLSITAGALSALAAVTKLTFEIPRLVSDVRQANEDIASVQRELEAISIPLKNLRDNGDRLPGELTEGLCQVILSTKGEVEALTNVLRESSQGRVRAMRWIVTGKAEVEKKRSSLQHASKAMRMLTLKRAMSSDIRNDTTQILSEIHRLRGDARLSMKAQILERYLDASTSYAESVYEESVAWSDPSVQRLANGTFDAHIARITEEQESETNTLHGKNLRENLAGPTIRNSEENLKKRQHWTKSIQSPTIPTIYGDMSHQKNQFKSNSKPAPRGTGLLRFLETKGKNAVEGYDHEHDGNDRTTGFLPKQNQRSEISQQGSSPLIRHFLKAVIVCDIECFDKMVNQLRDLNATDKWGMTPLMVAVMNGRAYMVRALLRGKSDVNARNERSETALMLFMRFAQPEITAALLGAGANPDAQRQDGMTALMMLICVDDATWPEDWDLVRSLRSSLQSQDEFPDISPTKRLQTLNRYIQECNNRNVGDMNIQDADSNTALHLAATSSPTLITRLLEWRQEGKHVDLRMTNRLGTCALDLIPIDVARRFGLGYMGE